MDDRTEETSLQQQQQQDINMNKSEEAAIFGEEELTSIEGSYRGRQDTRSVSARNMAPPPVTSTVRPSATLEDILDRLTNILAAQANSKTTDEAVASAMRDIRDSRSPLYESYKEPKVNAPDTFSGERSKLTNFLMQVNLVFKLQPRRYVTETDKIYYVVGYLRGAPETSIKSYLSLPDDKTPELLKDFSKFEEYLKSTWGDPDERRTAATRIYEVRQTGSSAQYFAQIEQYSAVLGWPDEVLITIGRKSLKDELKDALALQADVPEDWPSFVRRVNELDIRSYERHQEKNTRNRSDRDVRAPQTTTNIRGQGPRQSERRPNVTNIQNTGLNREPITLEERQRRMMNNLCLRCGKAGHIAKDCQGSGTPASSTPISTYPTRNPSYPSSTTIRNVYPTTGQSQGPPSTRLNGTKEDSEQKGSVRYSTKVGAPSRQRGEM